MNITTKGKRQLGAALGTRSFVEEYVRQKVAAWAQEIEYLSSIAITQPHAACAAFNHGLMNKWMFLARTIADISNLFQLLEEAIRHRFLPSLTGQNAFNDAERELMALPVCLGGLGITKPTTQTAHKHSTSYIESHSTTSSPDPATGAHLPNRNQGLAKESQVRSTDYPPRTRSTECI